MSDKKLITELTPEQEARRKEYFNEYLAIGWKAGPADRPTAEQALTDLYKRKGLKAPKFVWFESPMAAAKCAAENGFSDFQPTTEGQIDAYWVCYYKFCETLADDMYAEDDSKHLDTWDQLVRSTGPVWSFENYCLCSERPVYTEYDDELLLHSETRMAVEYSDGFGLWAIHGVVIPDAIGERVILRPWELTLAEIEDPDIDEDLREILVDRWCFNEKDSAGDYVGQGGGRWLKETGAVQIHEDVYTAYGDVSLLRVLLKDRDGGKWLLCTDSSTDRVYPIRVDDSAETCSEAHKSITGGIEDHMIKYSA